MGCDSIYFLEKKNAACTISPTTTPTPWPCRPLFVTPACLALQQAAWCRAWRAAAAAVAPAMSVRPTARLVPATPAKCPVWRGADEIWTKRMTDCLALLLMLSPVMKVVRLFRLWSCPHNIQTGWTNKNWQNYQKDRNLAQFLHSFNLICRF